MSMQVSNLRALPGVLASNVSTSDGGWACAGASFPSVGEPSALFPALLRGDLLVDTEVLFDCGYALESVVDLFSETADIFQIVLDRLKLPMN